MPRLPSVHSERRSARYADHSFRSGSSDVSGSNAVTRARPSTSPTGGQGSGISSVAQPNSSNTAAGTTTRSFMNTTRKTSTRQTLAVCPGPCKAVRSDARRMRTGHGGSVCAYCRPCSTSTARPMTKPPLAIRLAAPRGFCAGVTRAIQIVETCLEKYGAPVYVRHQIVHNQHVVRDLEARGAIFRQGARRGSPTTVRWCFPPTEFPRRSQWRPSGATWCTSMQPVRW